MTAPARPSRTVLVLRRLDRAAHQRWFLPAVGVFPLSDYALPVLPNQVLLTALAVLHPRRWWALTVTFVTAAGLGALLVAATVHATGPWLLDAIGGGPDALTGVTSQIRRHGLWALAALSLLPWPPRTAVLACALAGIPPWAIAAVVMAVRPLPVAAMAFTAANAPHLLRRLPRIDRLLTAVEADRTPPATTYDMTTPANSSTPRV
ncbi:hypothetical protein [Micromonospora sp. KC606]|uniref:hypothetical protein n=1 Tax=Micromonospora sp. KC606 TaxID=2530379 RepID=UPI001A9D86CD|nr:hypothetical protein [Micromonospora sp. KC606]